MRLALRAYRIVVQYPRLNGAGFELLIVFRLHANYFFEMQDGEVNLLNRLGAVCASAGRKFDRRVCASNFFDHRRAACRHVGDFADGIFNVAISHLP